MDSAELPEGSTPKTFVTSLAKGRRSLPASLSTREPGVYALWLTNSAFDSLGLERGLQGIAYVGVGSGKGGLGRRFAEEWRPKHSGRSSPRRTLGALLIEQLDLEPRPRPGAAHARNARYYTFGEDGERRLTQRLDRYAYFAGVEVPSRVSGVSRLLAELETSLIRYFEPPLNLTKWANPSAARIGLARTIAAERARSR